MAQQLSALTVLPEDRGSIPIIHVAVHNCLMMWESYLYAVITINE